MKKKKSISRKNDYESEGPPLKDFILMTVKAAIAGLFIVVLFYDSAAALPVGALAGFMLMKCMLKDYRRKRKNLILYHFRDFIFSLNTALKTGYSIENAIKEAGCDLESMYKAEDDTVREIMYISKRLKLRIPAWQLFYGWYERCGLSDIRQFAQLLSVTERSGGEISRMLSDSWKTICERIDTKKEIDSVLSSKLYEQKIVTIMPAVIILYLRLSFSSLIGQLYHNPAGVLIMSVCLLVYAAAFFWSRKLAEIEV